MTRLYERVGCLTAKTGGFRPVQNDMPQHDRLMRQLIAQWAS
jgi:hypothetical protein